MPKYKEKSNFMNVLERDILEDEVASKRFGSYSLLWFGGIIHLSFTLYKEVSLMEKDKVE